MPAVFEKEQYAGVFTMHESGFASALDVLFPHGIPIYFGRSATYKIS